MDKAIRLQLFAELKRAEDEDAKKRVFNPDGSFHGPVSERTQALRAALCPPDERIRFGKPWTGDPAADAENLRQVYGDAFVDDGPSRPLHRVPPAGNDPKPS